MQSSQRQEEEDLAMALALSSSLAAEEEKIDAQSLAFFTDIPLPSTAAAKKTNSSYEDMELACRLQREEEDSRSRDRSNDMKQIEIDSQFAKKLHDEEQKALINDTKATAPEPKLNVSNYSVNTKSNTCGYCKKSLIGAYKIVEKQLKLHPHCFICAGCNQAIQNDYAKKGSLSDGNIEFYHPQCDVELFAPNCNLCGAKLIGMHKTHGYFKDKQKFCSHHDVKRDHRMCCSCSLVEPVENHMNKSGHRVEMFNTLPDGRAICPECVSYVILESNEAKELYLEAVDFMEHSLNLTIPCYMREVPVLAVDLPSLNDQSNLNSHVCGAHPPTPYQMEGGPPSGNSSAGYSSAITRGLTISTTTGVRHFSPGTLNVSSLSKAWSNLRAPSVMTLKYHTSVTAVLVLCGLTRSLTASILAHEAMHVWLRLNDNLHMQGAPNKLPLVVEEGICQLVAYKYLEHIAGFEQSTPNRQASSFNDWNHQLRPYYMYQIESDPSPVYGEGFRQAAKISAAIGLQTLLDHVIISGNFPDI